MHSPAWRLEQHRAELELNSWRIAIDVARPDLGISLHDVRRSTPAPHDRAADSHEQASAVPRVLGVELSDRSAGDAPIVECYVRGLDLVATYTITELATRVQIYWRAGSDTLERDAPSKHAIHDSANDAVTAIDLQVSVQTDVLDASPRVSTRSVLASDRVERLLDAGSPALERIAMSEGAEISLLPDASPPCLRFPLLGGELVYVEMVHPADFRQCRLSRRGKDVVVEHSLFAEQDLEKGVIMRARVRGLLLRSAALYTAGAVETIVADAYERFVAAAPPLTT